MKNGGRKMKTKGKEQTFDYSYNAPEKITGIKD